MRRRYVTVLGATTIHAGITWFLVRQAAVHSDVWAATTLLVCAMASIGTGALLGEVTRYQLRRRARVLPIGSRKPWRRAG